VSGRLVLVGTPLGNLGDMTPRAIEALSKADAVLCEDARRTGALLTHFGIATPMHVLNDHNEDERTEALIERLRGGATLALVSDAGMPVVSDPGYPLVRAAIAAGIEVDAVPGPCAATLALVLSGFPPLPHAVFGFPPIRGGSRRAFADQIEQWPHAAVVFISPHRGADELAVLADACGDRAGALLREMTKVHQDVWRAPLRELAERVATDPPRGEWTLVIGPAEVSVPRPDMEQLIEQARRMADRDGIGLKEAAFRAAEAAGLGRRALYREILRRRGHPQETEP
jgi:16S rRNA (cytidine1402-2'-O)-methyltransferase